MTGGNNLVNFGGLAKPAVVLIEKVSDAVGGIAKPWQTKRVARAEAEAEKIAALAKIEISELQQRALQRMVREEAIKQENIEKITEGAASALNDDAKPEELSNDWLFHFFEKAKIVSDEEMQSLWSKLLAQEANEPNSCARKTVEVMAGLDRKDAQLFTQLCSYVWQVGELEAIVKVDAVKPNGNLDVMFSDLVHLQSLGLISFEPIGGYAYHLTGKYINLLYYGRPVLMSFQSENGNKLERGNVGLTRAGRELARIAGSKANRSYFDEVLQSWFNQGISIATTIDSKDRWECFK
ncbi:DUF2806 domain-containing protein [Pseudochrobactrum sp. Wa41.01b-1]|uniref:DUF2806 domain-containing protein n=1 Tax=Pseudochrobactrum sp. Wa41.01b-1 TaxID=2864102 RepID=UPI001C68DAD8|nr:DUF2806 domain-containing protein [Pseudochrobactrum sp. Wa41.01b-1]QYM72676.1 DUF2806 domain-containing protein [Pseudochrobactrum sp. Wa41.01b-1]